MGDVSALPYRAFSYAALHPAKVSLISGGLLLAVVLFAGALCPGAQAEAIAPIIVGAIAVAGLVGASVGIDAATSSLSDGLRDSCNGNLSLAVSIMHWSADLGMLTDRFEQLFPSIVPIVQGIHNTVAVPIANIVLAIFLVVGLLKLLNRAGQYESGIDVWQLIMVFCLYALMKTGIDASYGIMVLFYNIVRTLIVGTKDFGFSDEQFAVQGIPDDVTGLGWLLTAWFVTILVILIALAVAAITYIVVLVRSVQIYVYTTFASIPLSFLITESGRSVATGFLKRYIAVLGAGVIMALLLVMQSAIIGNIGASGTAITSFETGIQFLGEIILSTISMIAFAFCMFKSGAWARDFMGI